MDNLNSEQRRRNMASVTAKDTKPELVVRKLVHRLGYRYRLHVADLPGKPDLVFKRLRLVIFVNGCFWHQHRGCRKSKLPTMNRSFWTEKLFRNKQRDKQNKRRLTSLGWTYLVIWECETRRIDRLTEKLSRFLTEQEQHAEETNRH
ncbi:very short patch repair endonuclease [Rubripirellula obstinata]|uniref:very short patch repair endonuclease n=1 Tax=Rubripirellula obstinata TaxID=406547 RepID=UPI001EE3CFBF|nr:very short patch repair endonuclease [Rubripirellula obstinata]